MLRKGTCIKVRLVISELEIGNFETQEIALTMF